MKAEDFLIALNDADDAYVKKAGLKGGYLSMYSEAGIQKTEQSGTTRNLRQETAKQRNVKRFWLAAACLALVAVSCGAWMLLGGKLGARRSNGGNAAGSSTSQSTAASTEAAQTTGIDFKEEITLLVYGESARSGLAESPENAVRTLHNCIHFNNNFVSYNITCGSLEDEEAQQLLADAASGALGLQRGLGLELAALAEQDPERVSVVRTVFRGKKGTKTPYQNTEQYFFAVCNEEGFWKVVDACYTEAFAFPEPSEEAVDTMRRELEQLNFQPDKTPRDMIHNAVQSSKLDIVATCGSGSIYALDTVLVNALSLQKGSHAEIVEKLEQDPKSIEVMDVEFCWSQSDRVDDKIYMVETFFFVCNENGLWELLDATVPELV